MAKRQFLFRNIAYQEKKGSFIGVCLDLDIVEEGHATLQEAILSINDAIDSHIQVAAQYGYPKELINRPAPKEYWHKLEEITKPKVQQALKFESFQFFTKQPQVMLSAYA